MIIGYPHLEAAHMDRRITKPPVCVCDTIILTGLCLEDKDKELGTTLW